MTLPAPNACRHCGIERRPHGRRYTPDEVGRTVTVHIDPPLPDRED